MVFGAISDPRGGLIRHSASAPAPTVDYDSKVLSLPGIKHYWPIDSSFGDGLAARLGDLPLQLGSSGPLGGQPSIVDDDAGNFSMMFGAASIPSRLFIPSNADWNAATFTFGFTAVVMDPKAPKTILCHRALT